MNMKTFVKYWLPPLLWMALIFPVGNKALSSSLVYDVFMAVFKWLLSGASPEALGTGYIIFRKSLHFFEYGFLAFLLFRGLRAGRVPRWKPSRFAWAAGLAVGYGCLDELLQAFIPNRTGSLWDAAVDMAGILCALAVIARWSRKADATEEDKRTRPYSLAKALFLKRPFDIVLSFLGLILSSPLWIVIAAATWIQDRGPILYSQDRVGRGGRIFKAMKFRSMIKDAEKESGPIQAIERDPRVTPLGRLLRATALDELPQLVNIFWGDMSFVGPRALRPNELEVNGTPERKSIEDIPGYEERHAVRPGLTGLTQVFLPGDTERRKKFRYDLLYVRKQSFWLDLKLLVLSFWITFRGKWESREDKI